MPGLALSRVSHLSHARKPIPATRAKGIDSVGEKPQMVAKFETTVRTRFAGCNLMRIETASHLGFAIVAVVTVAGASILGQVATFPNLAPWYSSLTKPAFNPPNEVFAPVWTTLYVLMAFAAWRAMRLAPSVRGRRAALILFFIQLAFNAA
jgi:hypothetical protein